MNDVKEMLEDEIRSIMESMKTMSVDSEEYEKAIDALTKLTDRLNAIDKNQKELMQTSVKHNKMQMNGVKAIYETVKKEDNEREEENHGEKDRI